MAPLGILSPRQHRPLGLEPFRRSESSESLSAGCWVSSAFKDRCGLGKPNLWEVR